MFYCFFSLLISEGCNLYVYYYADDLCHDIYFHMVLIDRQSFCTEQLLMVRGIIVFMDYTARLGMLYQSSFIMFRSSTGVLCCHNIWLIRISGG